MKGQAKKPVESAKDATECLLRYGKTNNIVQWRERMEDKVCGTYGSIGSFFTTDTRYVYPYPRKQDYMPDEFESDSEPDVSDDDEAGAGATAAQRAAVVAANQERVNKRNAHWEEKRKAKNNVMNKLREGAYEGRRRDMHSQIEEEKKIYCLMWDNMTQTSQNRIKEEAGYKEIREIRDCVGLWTLIRRTHLTHMYGDGHPLLELNMADQENKYSWMRQGEKELISTFKERFDNQVKANEGVGVPPVTESRRALDFIKKLDPKRYRGLHSKMMYDALKGDPNAYPATLDLAHRIASGWTVEPGAVSANVHGDNHAAFSTDSALVTKAKTQEKVGEKKVQVPPGPKSKKTAKEITCYVCGGSHYARECEQRQDVTKKVHFTSQDGREESEDDDGEWDVALVAANEKCLFSKYDVLLDNEASLNIFGNRELLTNVRKSFKTVNVTGIDAKAKVTVNMEGDFGELGPVYFSDVASANIISFASQIDAGAAIRYDHTKDEFTLQPVNSASVYTFRRKSIVGSENKFYCCDWRHIVPADHGALVQTVSDNLKAFTKREVEQAVKARQMLAKMGFPAVDQAISMVSSGQNFGVTARDFQIADAIWGKDMASIKGKTVKGASPVADISTRGMVVQQQQTLAIDIMFIDKLPTLIGVATPLGLTLGYTLLTLDMSKGSRAAEIVKKGISYFVSVLKSQNFITSIIMTDGEGAVSKLTSDLNQMGIELDVSGAGGHVARVERKIRVIKERVRAHVSHHLPYALSYLGLSFCILYCVSRINYEPTGVREWGPSPREAFLGRKPDANRDFRCAFGDYAQCTVPTTDNSMAARTEDCIALLPTGNRTGTVRMLHLATGRVVSRDQFRIMPMPAAVIDRLNALALRDGRLPPARHGYQQHVVPNTGANLPDLVAPPPHHGIDPAIQPHPDDPPIVEEMGGDILDGPAHVQQVPQQQQHDDADRHDDVHQDDMPFPPLQDDPPQLQPEPDYDGTGEIGGDEHEQIGGADTIERMETAPATPQLAQPMRDNILEFFRKGGGDRALVSATDNITQSERALNISVREALRTRGADAERVILKELQQMVTKKVWRPIHGRTLTATERGRVIRSSMFLKEKYFPSGEYEKLKARLVAGGDQQDKALYDDLSAPTISTSSVFTLLTIAAHERRTAAVVDIGGAFLNAEMTTGVDVHMRLDPNISLLMEKIDPNYSNYKDHKGGIIVKLDRALYGCVESAALWYESLRETLEGMGYIRNQYDICVFNLTLKGTQCTVGFHVDDLLVTSRDPKMIRALLDGLKARYGEITETHGNKLNYLGMMFDLSEPGVASVTMDGYIEDILNTCEVQGRARTPATDDLFDLRPDNPPLNETEKAHFHRTVAKMLYLSKRVRPDCLTAVSFLCTRVTRSTHDDMCKLVRLLRYLRATKERGIRFKMGSGGVRVSVYVDASYGVHADGKSHTGSCVVIGDRGSVHTKSAKQNIVTKSSTEAELVALSDSANQGLHMRNFLIDQGYADCGPVTMYQDNMSCMALVDRGRPGGERTRHIAIRYFWVKERVTDGEAVITHLGTERMYANLLTKPLQGGQFVRERAELTGWD